MHLFHWTCTTAASRLMFKFGLRRTEEKLTLIIIIHPTAMPTKFPSHPRAGSHTRKSAHSQTHPHSPFLISRNRIPKHQAPSLISRNRIPKHQAPSPTPHPFNRLQTSFQTLLLSAPAPPSPLITLLFSIALRPKNGMTYITDLAPIRVIFTVMLGRKCGSRSQDGQKRRCIDLPLLVDHMQRI